MEESKLNFKNDINEVQEYIAEVKRVLIDCFLEKIDYKEYTKICNDLLLKYDVLAGTLNKYIDCDDLADDVIKQMKSLKSSLDDTLNYLSSDYSTAVDNGKMIYFDDIISIINTKGRSYIKKLGKVGKITRKHPYHKVVIPLCEYANALVNEWQKYYKALFSFIKDCIDTNDIDFLRKSNDILKDLKSNLTIHDTLNEFYKKIFDNLDDKYAYDMKTLAEVRPHFADIKKYYHSQIDNMTISSTGYLIASMFVLISLGENFELNLPMAFGIDLGLYGLLVTRKIFKIDSDIKNSRENQNKYNKIKSFRKDVSSLRNNYR